MYKLLIADDEKIIRESVAELIDWDALDIQITASCKNGMEALDAIMDTAPDIVMTDIRMPGIDGLELIDKIRSLDSHIQFIILTGYPEFEYARRALQYGVREYLLKPISEEAIISAVNSAKAALPAYSSSTINQLIAELTAPPSEETAREKSQELLDRFLSHFHEPEELKALGFNLIIELHTRCSALPQETLTKFTGKLLEETDPGKLQALITSQILELLFTTEQTKVSLADTVKKYVLEYLDDENLSLKFIAENLLYVNVNYLSRAFTKQSGEKFSNYLNRTRIDKAKKLILQSKGGNIHDAAEAVGFGGNPQYFSQVFKKYTGITPTQFAEEGEGPGNDIG